MNIFRNDNKSKESNSNDNLNQLDHKQLTTIFGSKTKADEILLLLNDHKEVVRQAFYEEEFFIVKRFCKKNNIHLCRSKFKVILSDEETGNYSNKGIVIPENDKRPAAHFYYFSKSEEKSYLANYYELTGNVQEFGLLLGYPKCCVKFFINNFSINNPNPELKHSEMDKVHPLLNISQRRNDAVLISHFPCSFNCNASIDIAERKLTLIKQNFRGRAQELIKILDIQD